MRATYLSAISFLITVALSTGCGSDTPPSPDSGTESVQEGPGATVTADGSGVVITGNYTGLDIPDGSQLALIWMVSSGSPDYDYKLGDGTMDNGTFTVTLPRPLPAEAINSWGIGVGLLVVVPANTVIADGIMEETAYDDIFGLSPQHSIIWREATVDTDRAPWGEDFPEGYSCGSCVSGTGTFDGFSPTDCSEPVVMTDLEEDSFCNWT